MQEGADETEVDLFQAACKTLDRIVWNATSVMVAKLHNVNCMKRSDTITPDQINPYSENKSTTRGMRLTRGNVGSFIAAICKQNHNAN